MCLITYVSSSRVNDGVDSLSRFFFIIQSIYICNRKKMNLFRPSMTTQHRRIGMFDVDDRCAFHAHTIHRERKKERKYRKVDEKMTPRG